MMQPGRRLAIAAITVAMSMAMLSTLLDACSPAREQLPDRAFVTLDGQRHQLAALQGHVTLVHFWSTGCAPCLQEMPELIALHQRLSPQGLETLAVASPEDAPAVVIQYAQSRQLPFKVVLDLDGALLAAWGPVEATPTTLVLDAQGRVVQRIVGPIDFAALGRDLQRLLDAASAAPKTSAKAAQAPHITRDSS